MATIVLSTATTGRVTFGSSNNTFHITSTGSIRPDNPALTEAVRDQFGLNALIVDGLIAISGAGRVGASLLGGRDTLVMGATGLITSDDDCVRMGGDGFNAVLSGGTLRSVDGNALDLRGPSNVVRLLAGSMTTSVTGDAVLLDGPGLNHFIAAGTIRSYSGAALNVQGNSNTITLEGSSVTEGVTGLTLSGSSNAVGVNGLVRGIGPAGTGVNAASNGGTFVVNGSITGELAGMVFGGGGTNALVNTGTITSYNGIAIDSTAAMNFTNNGRVEGDTIGLRLGVVTPGVAGAPSAVVNDGTIIGFGGIAIEGQDSAETIVNNGTIVGIVSLGAGNDYFDGRNGGATIVHGDDGADILLGGYGTNSFSGGAGNDQLLGGPNNESFGGGDGNDVVMGQGGNDSISGGAESDVLDGGDGNDTILANQGNDTLYGGSGNDGLVGNEGVDIIYGGAGADLIFGEADSDLIYGGAGNDTIRGGLGGDLFVFNVGDNGDVIVAFNEGGVRDGFDLRSYFDAIGYTGTNPRAAGIMFVLQNGADTDVYLQSALAFRIQGVVAAAIDDTYFLFQ